MRCSRKMQGLLKIGLVIGVCSSLWLFYVKDSEGSLSEVGLDIIGEYVDLSRFGLGPALKESRSQRKSGTRSSSKREKISVPSDKAVNDEGNEAFENVKMPSPEERRKEDEARLIQDEAIRRAAEIAEKNRKREEAILAENIRQKEAKRLYERTEDAKRAKEDWKIEEARIAEEKKKIDEERTMEERREKEEAQRAEENRKREEAQIRAEEDRKKEEAQRAEENRKREEAQIRAEENRKKEEAQRAEENRRREEEARRVEENRKREEVQRADENKKKEEAQREERKIAEKREKDQERIETEKKKTFEQKLAAERIAKANRIVEENKKRDEVPQQTGQVKPLAGKDDQKLLSEEERQKRQAELAEKIKEATERAEEEKKKELKRFYESKRKEQERTQEEWKKEQEERFKKIKRTNEEKKLDDERRADEERNAEMFIDTFRESVSRETDANIPDVHLAVVACGDRLEETVVLLKSARILSRAHLHFHVFADEDLMPLFETQLAAWPKVALEKTTYHVRPLSFPKDNSAEWKKLFKPCASQRLFLPELMEDQDAVLYLDTDILFLTAPEDIWSFFKRFNSSQIAALSPEHEDGNIGWYNRFARHPYYHPLGVNSGVMLMNLTRMRTVDWVTAMIPYHAEYKYRITWGDQDLINIFFHFHPDMLYIYPCHWNFRPDHCMYMSICKYANEKGVNLLHGNRRVWFNEKQPAFKAVYTAFKEFTLNDNIKQQLLDKMRMYLKAPDAQNTNCGKLHDIITKQLEHQIKLHTQGTRTNEKR